jgi:MazG family protein
MSHDQPESIQKLFGLIERLRGDGGCPWDREQKLEDILSDLVEEAYELEWAALQNPRELFEEMGDVLFLVCFAMAVKHETDPEFTIEAIARHAHDKIYSRHPHVFGDERADTAEESLRHWEKIKARERNSKQADGDVFDGVAGNLPPIRLAEKMQERAASVGFDWDEHTGIIEKLHEEIDELDVAIRNRSRDEIHEELGDLLFSVINLTRFLNIDASGALNATTTKFVRRFNRMRAMIHDDGRKLEDMTLEEMDRYWNRTKST